MKQKRRKKTKREWAEFQAEYDLSEADIRLARQIGYPIKQLKQILLDGGLDDGLSVAQRIAELYRLRQHHSSLCDTTDHDSIVRDWKENAQRNDDQTYAFLRSLKSKDYSFEPDELVVELHEKAFQKVDCTRCANCCKTPTTR